MYQFKKVEKVGNYKIIKTIGKGSEGEVFLAEYNSQKYALKKINSKFKVNLEIYKSIKQNKNLVRLIEVCVQKEDQYQVYEYCSGGNLTNRMQHEKFDQYSIVLLLRQICNGYKELISNNIIHRDLKPDNIIFEDGQAKIADFGFARFVEDPNVMNFYTSKCTPLYAAPQIFTQYFSSKCDIWSLGIILYEIIYGQRPNFKVKQLNELFDFHRLVKANKLFYPQTDKTELVTLTKCMIKFEEIDRIDWMSLFKHPYITGEEERRIGLQFDNSEQFVQRYFENKVEQFKFFLNLLLQCNNDSDQEFIVLKLWDYYILHITAQISGTILMESIIQSQIFYIKTQHCQQLKGVISKYKYMIEQQMAFHNFFKESNNILGQKIEKQHSQDSTELIKQLNFNSILQDQIKYILNN